MAKKNFDSGINAILKKTTKEERIDNKTKTRTSIMLNEGMLEALRAIAYWNRTTLKNEIETALEAYLSGIDENTLKKALSEYHLHQEKDVV